VDCCRYTAKLVVAAGCRLVLGPSADWCATASCLPGKRTSMNAAIPAPPPELASHGAAEVCCQPVLQIAKGRRLYRTAPVALPRAPARYGKNGDWEGSERRVGAAGRYQKAR
jgi:hypothetical protein